MADTAMAESGDENAPTRRRANIRLAVVFGVIALGFYVSMFVFMS